MEAKLSDSKLLRLNFKNFWLSGIDYEHYKMLMDQDLKTNEHNKIKEYIKLNQSRMHRVEKTYLISNEILQQLSSLKNKIRWLVISEHWCGDASQISPVLNAIVDASDTRIEMKLLYRDQVPALMDAFLTNGTSSIPKLIQLNQDFNVTGTWGPRPSFAQNMVKELKANPSTAATYAKELHLWYAKDKQQAIERELSQLIQQASN